MNNARWQIPDIEVIEVMAFQDLFERAPRSLKDMGVFECRQIGTGLAISFPSAPVRGLNRIFGMSCQEDLEIAHSWMSDRRGSRWLQVDDSLMPSGTNRWIHACDLTEDKNGLAKLRRSAPDATLPLPPSIVVRKAQVHEATSFAGLMCEGFGLPADMIELWSAIVGQSGWSCFIADYDGVPAGTAAMYACGGLAWFGGGSTLAPFRNKGVQKALINARLNEGGAMGVREFAVETDQPQSGEPNISNDNLKRTGFQTAYLRKAYLFAE